MPFKPSITYQPPEKYFTSNEVEQANQKCIVKKFLSYVFITAEVVRYLPIQTIVLITHIFNTIL